MKEQYIKKESLDLLNIQLVSSILFIISVIISIILTYDEKQNLLKKQTIFSEQFDRYLNLFNRILALGIILVILYINYIGYKIGKQKGSKLPPLEHQIIASIFSVISAIIVLYVVLENWEYNPNITSIENPTI